MMSFRRISYDVKRGTPGEYQCRLFSVITTSGPKSEFSSVNPYQMFYREYIVVFKKNYNIFLHAGAKEDEMKEIFFKKRKLP